MYREAVGLMSSCDHVGMGKRWILGVGLTHEDNAGLQAGVKH